MVLRMMSLRSIQVVQQTDRVPLCYVQSMRVVQ